MGFYIKDNKVYVDHEIRDFGDTTDVINPTSDDTLCAINPMKVTSIFLRRRHKEDKAHGDNCPLIYALKKKKDLSVSYSGIKPLIKPFNSILDKFLRNCEERGVTFDAVIPMPSSHRVAAILAHRVASVCRIPVFEGAFQKSSCLDIRATLDTNNNIPHEAKMNIFQAINAAQKKNCPFSLSEVKTLYRQYVEPLKLQTLPPGFSILLVDDLFASGKTLIAAKDALYAAKPTIQKIESLCLFSPLNGRIKNHSRVN